MMVVFGVFSVIQILFLPGLFVVYFLKLNKFWVNLLIILSVSPIINFLLVFILAAIHLYTKTTLLILFAIECIILLFLYFSTLSKRINDFFPTKAVSSFFQAYVKENTTQTGWRRVVANIFLIAIFLLAVFCIFYYFSLYGLQTSSTFTAWDPIFSWDRWAVDWSNNQLAEFTHHYPQLLPSNWSMTYVFLGDSRVKSFAKNYSGYIEIFILLAIFIAGLKTRKAGYFYGVIVTAWLQLRIGSNGSGYADTPVSFWGLLPYLFLLFAELDHKNWKKYISMGAIISAGAMITKQVGAWVVFTYLILVLMTYWKEHRKELWPLMWKIGIICFLIVVPWYVYAEYDIRYGTNTNELAIIVTLGSEGLTWFGTLKSALSYLFADIGIGKLPGSFTFAMITILFAFSFKDKFWRKINLLVTMPFFYLWIFYAGYDKRNMNLIVPLLGIAVGFGLQTISQYRFSHEAQQKFDDFIYKIGTRIWNWVIYCFSNIRLIFFLPLLLLVFILPQKYTDTYLIEKSVGMLKRLGSPEVDGLLYQYFEENENEGMILTDYRFIEKMPELSAYYKHGTPTRIEFIDQMEDDNIGYVLTDPQWMIEEVDEYFSDHIKTGEIEIVFDEGGIVFYTICHGPCD